MNSPEGSSLKEALRKNVTKTKFASIFGSFSRGNYDPLSDIDVFIVCEDEADKSAISNILMKLGYKVGKKIHINIFTSDDFEERVRNYDYLIASILDDSEFIFGDEDSFFEGKRRIFRGLPNLKSVGFNKRMGLKMVNSANDRLRDLLFNSSFSHNLELGNVRDNVLIGCLRDYHLGFGYLAASANMRRLNKAITLGQLLTSDDYFFIKDLILTEKSIIRKGIVDLGDVNNLFNYSKRLLQNLI